MRAPWLALLVTGCCFGGGAPGTAPPEPPPEPPAPRPTVDGPFVYAHLERTEAPTPARFSAPWPSDPLVLSGEWPETAPPRSQASARLCAGDEAAMRSWVDAVSRAPGDRERALLHAAALVEYCSSSGLCARGRTALEAGATGTAADLARIAIATCGRDEDREIVEAEGSPAAASAIYLDRLHPYGSPVDETATPARVAAVRTLLLALDPELGTVRFLVRGAAGRLAQMEGGVEALRGLEGSLPAHAAELVRETLATHERVRGREDDGVPTDPGGEDGAGDPAAEGRDTPEASAELEACARRGGWEGRSCLVELAELDRPRAVALARELGERDEEIADAVHALVRFPGEGALEARLRELGLIAPEQEVTETLFADAALLEAARATSFDTETGTYPNEHDALLAELAALAPGTLDGVVFEEIAPSEPTGGVAADFLIDEGELVEAEEDDRPYVVRAYADGARFETTAENLGDWYDVATVVGMLNTLARERSSDVRWVVLETGDQTAIVAAGPERGLRTAVEERLLRVGSSEAGAEARDHEEEMIRELMERGEL